MFKGILFSILCIAAYSGNVAAESQWVDGKPNYYEVTPPITVNLNQRKNAYAQVKVSLMSFEAATMEAVDKHKPAIVHELIMMISTQSQQTMQSVEGRRKVQDASLDRIRTVLQDLAGIVPGVTGQGEEEVEIKGVEKVLFTDFVIQ